MVEYLLGFMAGILSAIGYVPQIVKAIKTKSTGDLSLAMIGVFLLANSLWFLYGFIINSLPLIIMEMVILVLALMLLGVKLKYDKGEQNESKSN